MSRLALLVLAVAACGGGSSSSSTLGNRAPAGGDTRAAVLAREIGAGAPVAIVPGPAGLRAISADGARERTLAPGPVPWALVDDRAQVVWFGSSDGAAILMIDLAAPGGEIAVETVASGLPTETDAGAPLVGIRYPDHARLVAGAVSAPRIMIELSAEPGLSVDGGILELWEATEPLEAAVAAATVATDRLRAIAERGAGRAVSRELPATPAERVTTIDPSACPDDPDICGTAEPVAAISLWRVAVEYSCGDFCYVTWQLYDPAAGQLRTEPWLTGFDDVWVAPDGSAFVSAGRVIRFDTGPVAATPEVEAVGGGWLGGGYYHGI